MIERPVQGLRPGLLISGTSLNISPETAKIPIFGVREGGLTTRATGHRSRESSSSGCTGAVPFRWARRGVEEEIPLPCIRRLQRWVGVVVEKMKGLAFRGSSVRENAAKKRKGKMRRCWCVRSIEKSEGGMEKLRRTVRCDVETASRSVA